MHQLSEWVDHSVDRICRLGCRRVGEIIRRMESGERVAEVAGLSPQERQAVLTELRSIMAVYGGACPAQTVDR